MRTLQALSLVIVSLSAACAAEDPNNCTSARCREGQRMDGTEDPAPPPTPPPTESADAGPPEIIITGRAYKGFGDTDLTAMRDKEPRGDNRGRVKPFAVLGQEYARVLGAVPASLPSQEGTFKAAPPRWFEEPEMTGVTLFSSYTLGLEACTAYVGKNAARFSAAPTAASADAECKGMQRAFWSREPQPAEIAACTTFALTKSQEPSGTVQKRWAHTCASIVSAAPFLTY